MASLDAHLVVDPKFRVSKDAHLVVDPKFRGGVVGGRLK